jgi:hypothetical protein
MRIRCNGTLNAGLFLLVSLTTANVASAQIVNQVDATISHSFIVSTKTLPPGKYTFQVQQDSDNTVMTVTSADGKNSDQFLVRDSQASTTPAHTELIFRRYGNVEFLSKIFAAGNKLGVAVSEPSKQEKELQAQGKQPTEHAEGGGD